MLFYTTSSFRNALARLMKKRKDGYQTVMADICSSIQDMPDNIIRDTNERIIQMPEYRIIKLRVPNSGRKLSKADGFRLVYFVSLKNDVVVFLTVYPKRGSQGIVNLSESEYIRLVNELTLENSTSTLHQVDIYNMMSEMSTNAMMG